MEYWKDSKIHERGRFIDEEERLRLSVQNWSHELEFSHLNFRFGAFRKSDQ